MNTARYTQLLNYNNFAVIGGDDRVFNTSPGELINFIKELPIEVRKSPLSYLTVINCCKSLIMNTGLSNFDFELNDILQLWEIRLICMIMFQQSGINEKIIQDQSIQFEVKNLLTQFAYLNQHRSSITKNVLHHDDTFQMNKRFQLLLNWIRFHGKDIQLIDLYYKEVFQLRTKEQDQEQEDHLQESINGIYWGIISAMCFRGEILAVLPLLDLNNNNNNDNDKEFKKELKDKLKDLKLSGNLCLQRYLQWHSTQFIDHHSKFHLELQTVYDKWCQMLQALHVTKT